MLVIYIADDKSKGSLHPIILNHVLPGSTIYSDKMASYCSRSGKSHLEPYGFTHFVINHSLNYVDPISPHIHTNNIERSWRSLKSFISYTKRSMAADVLETYINTFLLKINNSRGDVSRYFL